MRLSETSKETPVYRRLKDHKFYFKREHLFFIPIYGHSYPDVSLLIYYSFEMLVSRNATQRSYCRIKPFDCLVFIVYNACEMIIGL